MKVAIAVLMMLAAAACGSPHRGNGGDDDDSNDGGGADGTNPNLTPCQAAAMKPSNLGCEFYAVDLPNEVDPPPISSDAAAAQYAIVVANDNTSAVNVTVTINTARYGDPVQEMTILQTTAAPGVAQRVDLPQREIDGSMGQGSAYVALSGTGTFVSSRAFHITTDQPVVIYQFNPIVQEYSNDASTLIPVTSLGINYTVLGFPTANPCGISGLTVPGIPDHTYITIMAAEDDTHVTVHATHPIHAAGGDSGLELAAIPKNTTFTLALPHHYDIANLASDQPDNVDAGTCITDVNAGQNGDFTGSTVTSDKPISVFTSGQRAIGFADAMNVVYPPDWGSDDSICCTDHVEEQLFPTTALGKEFAIARSPIRSTDPSGWIEPDIIRVVGTIDATTVTTNLPSPYDSFMLNSTQEMTFASTTGFTLTASSAVEVNSFTVPQQFVKHGDVGDPSQVTIPAAEQFREQYVFLVPDTFQNNYMALARPMGMSVILDGVDAETSPNATCTTGAIGMLDGTMYDELTCKLTAGQHSVSAAMPFGLLVWGYYSVSAYAYFGGSDIKIINPIL